MTISQVALSNTFNEFRTTFNDAANTVNSLIPSANAISANTITLSALTSGRVPLVSTAGLIVDDSNLTYNTSTDILTLGGATDASSSTTGTLIVTGGVGVAKKLYVGTDLSVAGNATFTGNVTILGSNSEISTTQINVNDPLIQLANNNTSNTVDIGLFGQYNSGSANVYSGVFRDASDGTWKFFKDYNVEPGTTIDPAANEFSYANVSIGALSTANNISIGTGQAYQINGANVLSSTVLGSTVLSSSLTSVGTIGTGVWQGTLIGPTYGGTGVNNASKTITLGGNLVTSGAFATTLTATGTTGVTLPTSGTLVGSADTGTVTSTMIADGTIVDGDINASAAIAVSKLASSAVTVGTTAITLGTSSTTLAGLTSVTSTSFVGALTGNASTVTTNANLTGGVTSVGNAATVVTNANLTGGVTSVGNAATVVTNANLTGHITSTGNATVLGSFTSAQLLAALTDETGTGAAVFATSPTLVTPALGTPSALVGTNITGTATSFTASNVTTNANLTGHITSVGNAAVLGSFTSLQLLTALTDETGSGANVFATSPTLVTPALGTPSALVGTNITGTATSFTASNVTTNANLTGGVTSVGNAATVVTNANLTGHITSVGNAAVLGSFTSAQLLAALTDETGSGAAVFANTPTLIAPLLGTPTSGNLANCTFPTLNQNTSGSAGSVANALTIGTGLGGTSYNGSSAVTITNTGVTSAVAGTGIGVSAATGAVTITNNGVTSLANGGGITASVSTGAVTLGSTATNLNTASAIVARDASGNFSAGTITATLSGSATSATTAGTVTTAAQPSITSVGTLTGLTVSATITGSVTGNAGTVGGFTPSASAGVANRVVVANASGYIDNNYFYTTGGGSERNASGLGYFAGFNSSDYYIRSYTPAAVASAISGQSMNISGTATGLSATLAIASGGTGTSSPAIVAGTGISVSGSFPNQTITNTVSAGVTAGKAIAFAIVMGF